jgi:hypothetical protein
LRTEKEAPSKLDTCAFLILKLKKMEKKILIIYILDWILNRINDALIHNKKFEL